MDDDTTIERPENLEALTLEDLRSLHARASTRAAGLRGLESPTLAEAREMRSLVALANECAGLVAEASQPVADVADLPDLEPVADPPVAAPDTEPASPSQTEVEASQQEERVDETQVARAAAALTAADVAGEPAAEAPSEEPARNRAAFVAAVGNGTVEAGAELDFDDMITPISRVIEESRAFGRAGRRVADSDREVRIASITMRDPADERLSPTNSALLNTRMILEAQDNLGSEERPARAAAVCGPPEIIRDIPECIGMERPVRGLFPQIPSERASFEFIPSIGLAAVAGGVTVWTDGDQATVDEADPATWKPCVDMVCANTTTANVSRIPSCMTVETMQSLSAPEQIENWISTLSALTERTAEGELLNRIDALSSAYTVATAWYGALPTLYNTLATLLGMAGDLNRHTDLSDYVLIVPNGLTRFLGLDSFSRESAAEREIERMMTELGIRSITTPDYATGDPSPWAGSFPLNPPGGAPVALPDPPIDWTFRLVDPTQGAFFSPDEFGFSMARDPQLMRQNKTQWFGELFEGLLKNGCGPWFTFTLELCPNGDRADGSTPIDCTPPLGAAKPKSGGSKPGGSKPAGNPDEL